MDSLAKTWKQSKKLMREKLKALSLNKSEPTDWMPILVLYEIIGFLSLPERLKCKQISKQWKMAVETAEGPHSLFFYRREFPYNVKWCFSERTVAHEDLIYVYPEFRNLNSRIELFEDLQRLGFSGVEMSEFFKDLHLLRKLKVLMIEDYYLYEKNCQDNKNLHITLHSNSLEKLSFKSSKNIPSNSRNDIKSIEFNTPKMSSLIFWNDGPSFSRRDNFPVRFRFPLVIKHLECIEFDSNLSVLRNLETLVCQKIGCPFKLADFKSLQRLELFPNEESELEYIEMIVNEKWDLQRESLEIIVCGFKDLLVACKPEFDPDSTIFELSDHYLRQVIRHPDNFVGHIPWQFEIVNFPSFYKSFRELPEDFFQKFANISSIFVSDDLRRPSLRKRPNPPDLLQLLVQTNPKTVFISFSFSYFFYEDLTLIESINFLDIKERSKNLNFNFFLNLKFLKHLNIHTDKLPIEFIPKIFKLRFMRSFVFRYLNFCIVIRENHENYSLYKAINTKKTFDCYESTTYFERLNDLVEALKRFKKKNRQQVETDPPYLRECLL